VAETTIGPPLVSTKEKIEAGFARAEARYARMLDGTQVAAVAIIAILATCADVASAEVTGTLCSGCSVSCTSHGIAAQMNEGISKTEICCRGDQCASPERNDRWEYRLPEEILANDYTCEGRTWDAKRGNSNFTIRCHAVDECKLIECRFCVDVVTNPACFPAWTLLIYGTFLTCVLTTLCCGLSLLRELRKNCRCTCQTITWCLRQLCCAVSCAAKQVKTTAVPIIKRTIQKRPKGNVTAVPGRGLFSSTRTSPATALLVLLLTVACQADDAVMSTARTEDCHKEGNRRTCVWNHVTTMTLLPAGQPVTLLMKDPTGAVMGTLQLTMNALTTNCVPRTQQWTWSYEVKTEAAKRCPGRGQCNSDFCHRLGTQDNVTELIDTGKYPHNTFCSDSCSTWWCGCAVPIAAASIWKACLFYGTYAWPTGK
jgi:hypothetical protein